MMRELTTEKFEKKITLHGVYNTLVKDSLPSQTLAAALPLDAVALLVSF